MRRGVVAGVLLSAIAGARVARADDAPLPPVSATAVQQSLAKATKWLLAAERTDNWEGSPTVEFYRQQKTGWTALVVDALLSAGVNPREPGIVAAVKFIKANPTDGVYALGLRMQVWQRLPPAADVKAAAIADLDKLLANIGKKGDAEGMYGYYGPTRTSYSHSRSQYAVQGAAAGRAMGLEVPIAFWKAIESAWVDHQQPDGGWSYTKANKTDYPETTGMTTVAVASLLVAHEALGQDESVDCRGTVPDPAITKGLKWLADHSATIATDDRTSRAFPFPTLYGIERVGAAGGVKYFGPVNWYEKGAAYLLSIQEADGSWGRTTKVLDGSPADLADTSFAVLFLARGQVPLFMQKLDYSAVTPAAGKAPQWDQRPRDVANLAHRTGVNLEQELGWQTISLAAPERDFHDAPILYIEGGGPITFDAPAKAKLKAFIEAGGMIVANADCSSNGFVNSIRKLGTDITPYEFRTLPAAHPIYTRQQFLASRWKQKPNVLGLTNGVRELMILLPAGDPGRAWEGGAYLGKEMPFELGADLFEYVASRSGFRSRGESYLVDRDASVKATATLAVGRLKYQSNWDPEPGSWRAMAAVMHNGAKVDLDVRTVTAADDWAGLSVVHLTGTQKELLLPAVGAKVRAFLAGGVDQQRPAAGGNTGFATSAEPQVTAWAAGPLQPVPPNDPLFSAGGTKLGPVKYRAFAVDARGKLDVPRLRGIKTGDRWAVIFSADDLSGGLVGEQVDGILGYDPATATDIVRHVLLYVLEHKAK
jgi:hypothetical protein